MLLKFCQKNNCRNIHFLCKNNRFLRTGAHSQDCLFIGHFGVFCSTGSEKFSLRKYF